MCKCSITVCTVHILPYTVSVCANTYTRTVNLGAKYCTYSHVSVNQWERRKNGKYKYANTRVVFKLMHATKNTRVVFKLMHATKVLCNVVLLKTELYNF